MGGSTIRFLALGAGQDVGRSCVVISMGGKNIMFDCGMHMGYNDERRFPDFTLLSPHAPPTTEQFSLTSVIDCVVITHFHLDHCGALPYLTEMCGYTGPIFMTHPTKALCPILLEDFRKIVVERKGETNFFTTQMIKSSIRRVTGLALHQTHRLLDGQLEVKPYYAGHVLGAAMFHVRVGGQSVVYTGDYNMTPDRHLGAAWLDLALKPDLLITESTYATTLRDSKRARERTFLRDIHQCVLAGGKVLIPVFALGRVQELCILVEEYWTRMGLSVPIYFSAGMAEMANAYYRVFVDWTNERLQEQYPKRNPFDFQHVRQFERHFADNPGPMVLFSSPGMLHSGMSLEIFKKWCHDPNNLLIIPGFCVSGTVGAKLLSGQRQITIEEPLTGSDFKDGGGGVKPHRLRTLKVEMKVKNMSFSAHADARGIMQLLRIAEPRNVILVHGEASKMAVLKKQIEGEMGIPCFDPANGELLEIGPSPVVPLRCDHDDLWQRRWKLIEAIAKDSSLDMDSLVTLIRERSKCEISMAGLLEWSREDALAGLPPLLKTESDRPIDLVRVTSSLSAEQLKSLIGNWKLLASHLQRALLPEYLVEVDAADDEVLRINSLAIDCNSGKVSFLVKDMVMVQKAMSHVEFFLDQLKCCKVKGSI